MTSARFRLLISVVLAVGVGLAALLIAIGFLASFAVGWDGSLLGTETADIRHTDFTSIVPGLLALRPIAIAQSGLLALLATPVVRVATSALAFAIERDRLYTGLTLVVLGVLLVSILFIR